MADDTQISYGSVQSVSSVVKNVTKEEAGIGRPCCGHAVRKVDENGANCAHLLLG